MSETTVIYMSNGKTYTVTSSPDAIQESFSKENHSDDLLKSFTLLNGKTVFINPTHVVAVETSELSNMDVSTSDETTPVSDKNRKDANLKAVKEFKKDIDGNMD